jgi:hypothetical protein
LKIISLYFQVSDNPTRDETEEITSLWQTGLWNSHIQADRFLLEDDRAIFMFKVSCQDKWWLSKRLGIQDLVKITFLSLDYC